MASSTRAALFGPFRLVLASKQLLKDGAVVPMGGRALELLVALVERPGEVVSKQELLASAWPDLFVEEANLRVQMTALRRILGDGQDGRQYIVNVARRGYSFVADVAFTDVQERGSAPPRGARQNLPLNLTSVLGRAEAVAAIGEELARHRFVSVVGPGGVGKTTVALEAARTALAGEGAEAPDAVILVELAPITDPALVEAAIVSAIGMTLGTGGPGLGDRLPADRALLILDNCEQVVAAAARAAEQLLLANPDLRLLVTSREPLRAKGEHVLRLPGLALPPTDQEAQAADALTSPAVRLFIERAASTLGRYEVPPDDVPAIVRICRRLDGIPLGIELAAGRVDAFGVQGVALRLDDVFRVLVAGRRTALARHQTLQATLTWSYDHLSPGEKVTLCRLSVFSGHFSLEAATAVTAIEEPSWDTIDHLTNLVSKSLVSADFTQALPRYRLLEITRAYALQKLRERGEFDRLSRRHALCIKEFMAAAEEESSRLPAAEWAATYASQLDNVRAALDWCFGPNGDRALGAELTISSAVLWFQLSLVDECRARFERAVASLRTGALDPAREVSLLASLGTALIYTIGPVREASVPWTCADRIARASGSVELRLRALWGLWLTELSAGRYAASLATAHDFERLARSPDEAGNEANLLIAHRILGISQLFLGRADGARASLAAAIQEDRISSSAIVRMQYDQELNARAFYSAALLFLGFQDQASALAARNVAEARERGHATTLSLVLVESGCPVAYYCGDLAAFGERLDLLGDVSGRHAFGPWRAWNQCFRGSLHLARGAYSDAVETLTAGIAALERTRWPIRRVLFLGHLAQALHGDQRPDAALPVIDQAIESGLTAGEGWILPELLRIKGEILAGDRPRDAMACLDEGFAIGARADMKFWMLRCAATAARLMPGSRQVVFRLRQVVDSLTEGHDKPDARAALRILASAEGDHRRYGGSMG